MAVGEEHQLAGRDAVALDTLAGEQFEVWPRERWHPGTTTRSVTDTGAHHGSTSPGKLRHGCTYRGQPAHLTVLKNAGLLIERRDGTRRWNRARPEGLARLRELLDQMWAASLDAARQIVEADRGVSDDEQDAAG